MEGVESAYQAGGWQQVQGLECELVAKIGALLMQEETK